ncbi:MAG: hypothetical protein ACREQV_03475, partial [Candidatus Binatia bacterium]
SHGGSPFILSRIVRSGERNRHLTFQLNSGHPLVERDLVNRPSSIGLTAVEVRQQYRGFDGIVRSGLSGNGIELVDGLAGDHEIPSLRKFQEPIGRPDVDLIYCSDDGSDDPPPPLLVFLGYEVGYYESADNYFSVVLNEIVFGAREALVAFGVHLNENLLFGSRSTAREFLRVRAAEPRGGDLESGPEDMRLIRIFGLRG